MLEHASPDPDPLPARPERDDPTQSADLHRRLARLAPRIALIVSTRLRVAPGVLGARRRVVVTPDAVARLLVELARERPELAVHAEPTLVMIASTLVRRRLAQDEDPPRRVEL